MDGYPTYAFGYGNTFVLAFDSNIAADSVQWSVRFNGECLIGQFGPASGGYHSIVTPILTTGSCLIGTTRPINW